MLSFSDERWAGLRGGYRVQVDLRPLLRQLESTSEPDSVWPQVWEQLYHQGDVGDGSFVAVPHLVRIHKQQGVVEGNVYAVVAHIELVRAMNGNPDVPAWARSDYDSALRELALLGGSEISRAEDEWTVRAILAVMAIAYGARAHGRLLVSFAEDEVAQLGEATLGPLSPNDAG